MLRFALGLAVAFGAFLACAPAQSADTAAAASDAKTQKARHARVKHRPAITAQPLMVPPLPERKTTAASPVPPVPETWTDAEIRRAIASGLARDGRTMHWQAMPWDHFSRLSPEDLEALVCYLRHLPPVRSRVPAPEPPRAGDEAGDTFFFGYSGVYSP